jgi:IS5 family transposase
MRKRFETQLQIGSVPMTEIKIPTKSRDEMPPLMRAMKEIYLSGELSEHIFSILEEKICAGKKKTGRPGMNLWSLFVLAQARLCLNTNYDRLHYLANNDKLLRMILGVHSNFVNEYEFEYQNIIDNVTLLDDATLQKINDVIVSFGHGVFKKKETEALRVKTDTFVVESNVHFPTDINLLWDSGRKCLDVVKYLIKENPETAKGWRKQKDWHRGLKNSMRNLSQVCKRGGAKKQDDIISAANEYLNKATALTNKTKEYLATYPFNTDIQLLSLIQLEYFIEMLDKHIDLVTRRLIKGETIPQEEKLYSIFETYTEWITKGKLRPNVELGKKVSIATDQFHLIIDYKVVDHTADVNLMIPLADRLLVKYPIASLSSDKGGWSKENKELLQLVIPQVIIPKKGKLNQTEYEQEHKVGYKKLRNKHSAIESNINELECNGLDRCPDRGLRGFKRYVGLAVIAYNLHRIGKVLLENDRKELKQKTRTIAIKRQRQAA